MQSLRHGSSIFAFTKLPYYKFHFQIAQFQATLHCSMDTFALDYSAYDTVQERYHSPRSILQYLQRDRGTNETSPSPLPQPSTDKLLINDLRNYILYRTRNQQTSKVTLANILSRFLVPEACTGGAIVLTRTFATVL